MWCTVQLRYIRTTHTRIIRAYFAYTRMSIHAHVRVYTRTYACIYARIWLFVTHSHNFLYLKHCQTKDISGNKEASLICIWLKCHADQWKLLRNVHFSVKRSEDPCGKNIISRSIWRKSFIQTVKYSFFSQRIVIKVSMARRSRLVIFYFKEKFCVLAHMG